MNIASRSQKYNVIGVNAITRNIHMIPFFEARNSASTTKREQDVYSYEKYLVNHCSDREAWEIFY